MAGRTIIGPTGNNPLGSGYGPIYPVDGNPGAVPRYADNRGRFHTIKIDLSVARNNERLKVTGNVLWAITASDLTAALNIKMNEQISEGIDYAQGLVISGAQFDQLFLTNAAQAGKSITLFYGVQIAPLFIQNFSQSFTSISGNVSVTSGATFTTNADVNCANAANTVLIGANANRKEVIISSPPGAGAVRINDGGGAEGIWLSGGQTAILTTQAGVSIRNDTGAAILMGVGEIVT